MTTSRKEERLCERSHSLSKIISKLLYSPRPLASALIFFLPDLTEKDSGYPLYTFILIAVLELLHIVIAASVKKPEFRRTASQIIGIIISVMGVWELLTAKLNILPQAMFPSPEIVLHQLLDDSDRLLTDVLYSLSVILKGYIPALVLGIVLGLICGWNKTLCSPLTYVSAFLKQIPPIVYIPYAIALLPLYSMVSAFIIFAASFWPIFSCTFSGVANVDKHILDSASVLKLSTPSMLANVIFPASLPEIFIGCNQGLAYSFILLTSAEMIGGNSGIGYYIKYYSDFGDFKRIIVGIIVIGIVITIFTFAVNKLQNFLLRWRKR